MKIIKSINEYLNESSFVYHGSDEKFEVFNDDKPIFFVDDINIARTYGDNIIKAELDVKNPIELDFEGKSTFYFLDKWYLPSDLADKIKEIADDIKNNYSLDDDIQEELEAYGFSDSYGDLDGIIMKNIDDSMGDIFSSHEPATNYVVFDKEQIKIVK